MIGSISSQFSEENSFKEVGKTGSKSTRNLGENNAQTPKFIGSEKLAVGVCQVCRSTARSTGQRSYFRPLCHRSTDRSTEPGYREQVSLSGRPLGRPGPFQRAELSGRSTGSVGRPSCQNRCARLCTSVDRLKPDQKTLRDLKLDLFD